MSVGKDLEIPIYAKKLMSEYFVRLHRLDTLVPKINLCTKWAVFSEPVTYGPHFLTYLSSIIKFICFKIGHLIDIVFSVYSVSYNILS